MVDDKRSTETHFQTAFGGTRRGERNSRYDCSRTRSSGIHPPKGSLSRQWTISRPDALSCHILGWRSLQIHNVQRACSHKAGRAKRTTSSSSRSFVPTGANFRVRVSQGVCATARARQMGFLAAEALSTCLLSVSKVDPMVSGMGPKFGILINPRKLPTKQGPILQIPSLKAWARA